MKLLVVNDEFRGNQKYIGNYLHGRRVGVSGTSKEICCDFFWGCCFCAEMRRNIPEVVNDESNLLGKCFRGRRVGISDTKKER